MKTGFFVLMFVVSLSLMGLSIYNISHSQKADKEKLSAAIYEIAEAAYFEGQKDALNGDFRIKQVSDSCWIWTKSPWGSGKKATFNPCE
jgi:hypothetical protein